MTDADKRRAYHAEYAADTAPRVCTPPTSCDWCGSTNVEERACKVICRECRRVSASCADL